MCVCVCVCVCVCSNICLHPESCLPEEGILYCICICIYMYIHVYMYVYTLRVCMCVCIYICIQEVGELWRDLHCSQKKVYIYIILYLCVRVGIYVF